MRNEINKALGTLVLLALCACGAQPANSTMDAALAAKLEAVKPSMGPSIEACQAMADQITDKADVLIDFGEADFFAPYGLEAMWVYEDGHSVKIPDGPQVLFDKAPAGVQADLLCTFEVQNGLVRGVQM